MKVFFDTNILVYACDLDSARKRETARSLLHSHAANGCLSTQVLQEFYVATTRKLGMAPLKVKKILTHFNAMEIVAIEPEDVHRAIDNSLQWKISFWDALVITAAHKARCSTLYSEDLNDGQSYYSIIVENPFTRL